MLWRNAVAPEGANVVGGPSPGPGAFACGPHGRRHTERGWREDQSSPK